VVLKLIRDLGALATETLMFSLHNDVGKWKRGKNEGTSYWRFVSVSDQSRFCWYGLKTQANRSECCFRKSTALYRQDSIEENLFCYVLNIYLRVKFNRTSSEHTYSHIYSLIKVFAHVEYILDISTNAFVTFNCLNDAYNVTITYLILQVIYITNVSKIIWKLNDWKNSDDFATNPSTV